MEKSFKKLNNLGWVQLITYVGILIGLTLTSGLVALPGDNGPIQGIGSVFELLYLGGGFFLVPSALIFIKANPATSLGTIGIAQTLQKALFIGCCIALLPLLLMLGFSQVPGVLLFLATVAGLVFYAAQSTYTKEVLVNRG